ncbi:hypothetical protein DWX23_18330 [Parabacteroides sp. AF18-52]|jgi:type I site-specific deoxyribonuclease restriction subunit|nr:hypothetical protein DWX23_18330 [Parabacteroides sp. AF18-52]
MSMKEGWVYRKWIDVLTIINGRNQKEVESKNGKYPICGSGGIMGYANDYLCPEETVIIGRKGNINNPIFMNQKFWNVDTAFGLVANTTYLLPRFLFYFCKEYDFERHNRAVTIPSLTKKDLYDILIPLPSICKQETIVTKLDKLNEILVKKREQLKELDRLGQAIFYDMFGDLQSNICNYNIESLNDIFELITDGTHQTPTYTIDKDNGYKFLSAKDVVSGSIDWTNVKYIPHELHEVLYKRLAPRRNDILLCKNGTTGTCALVDTDEVFDIYVSLALLRPYAKYNPIYLVHAINSPCTKMQFNDALKGVGVPNLHLGEIRRVKIIVPPIDFQNHFERKVIGIESQKQKIKQSIVEVQQLLDYTMNKYFG